MDQTKETCKTTSLIKELDNVLDRIKNCDNEGEWYSGWNFGRNEVLKYCKEILDKYR